MLGTLVGYVLDQCAVSTVLVYGFDLVGQVLAEFHVLSMQQTYAFNMLVSFNLLLLSRLCFLFAFLLISLIDKSSEFGL